MTGLNFTAIDFETANNFRRSACSMGLAKVRNGIIVETKYWLVKPDPLEVGYFQQKVHGLTLEDLFDKPTFQEQWEEIGEYLKDEMLVAHNSSFDLSVLEHLCIHYGIDHYIPSYFCTLKASKVHWKGELSYSLSYLCTRLGIELSHHHAESDAIACAKIAIELAKQKEVNDLDQVSMYSQAPIPKKKKIVEPIAKLPEFSLSRDPEHVLFEKNIVFTGALSKFTRADAAKLVEIIGGIPASGLTLNTHVLVIGGFEWSKYGSGFESSKLRKAKELMAKGSSLEILTEADFYSCIGI